MGEREAALVCAMAEGVGPATARRLLRVFGTYRGVVETLEKTPKLRSVLGLKSVPNYSALQRFEDRLGSRSVLLDIWEEAYLKTKRFLQWLQRHSFPVAAT